MKTTDFTTIEHLKDFTAFYNSSYGGIYHFVYCAIRSKEATEEVVNDVFMKFQSNLHRFDFEKSSPNTYLHIIAKSVVIDYFRKENKHTNNIELDSEDTYLEVKLSDRNSDRAVQNISFKETTAKVQNIISKMKNNDHKKVSELFFFDDLSYQQIADICQISLANVKVILNRCRQTLQSELKAAR